MWVYVVIFLLILASCFVPEDKQRERDWAILFFGVVLVLLAGFRGEGVSKDYHVYKAYFNEASSYSEYFSNTFREPSFIFIPVTLKKLGIYSEWSVFTTFAIIGVLINFIAIYKFSPYPAISILVFYSNYFVLHEMTQIRVGIACGFLLFSLEHVKNRNIVKFLIFILLGTFFHYTALIFIPVYFLNTQRISKVFYFMLLSASILLAIVNFGVQKLLYLFNFGMLQLKLDLYIGAHSDGTFQGINIFNALILINIIMGVFILLKIKVISTTEKYAILFIKLHFISLILFYMFSSLVVFAWRFSELFGIAQFVLFPMAIHSFKEKWAGQLLLILVAAIMFYLNVFYSNLLNPYFN